MSFLSDLLGEAYKENMTEDEISNALKGLSILNGDYEKEATKLKNLLSDRNGQIAKLKDQLKEKQSDDENKRQEEKEMFERLAKENEDLKRSISLSEKKSKLIAMGYDEKMAEETANAMLDGDYNKVLENQSKYLDAQKKTIETDLLKKTPRPNGGSGDVKEKNLDELITEAVENGNFAEQAYYVRVKEQQQQIDSE